ncbi:MAG: pantetheine-phosphate adenylyltransferase [Candidatus Margulisiibacteriota bacterium]
MKKAIYAGSFDPITLGHVDIIRRALVLFDEVHIAILHNPLKASLFSLDERIDLVRSAVDDGRVKVEGFRGLLADFASQKQIFTIIRGLRAVSDFDYEIQMAHTNRLLQPQLDTVFLMTDVSFSYLSSSLVKQVASFGGNISRFVPPVVGQALQEKYR